MVQIITPNFTRHKNFNPSPIGKAILRDMSLYGARGLMKHYILLATDEALREEIVDFVMTYEGDGYLLSQLNNLLSLCKRMNTFDQMGAHHSAQILSIRNEVVMANFDSLFENSDAHRAAP